MTVAPCDHSKRKTVRSAVLRELRQMQEVAMRLIVSPETKPAEVAQLMRAHVAAEQQRNVLKMRPAPKPVDVTTYKKHRSRSTAGLDPGIQPAT